MRKLIILSGLCFSISLFSQTVPRAKLEVDGAIGKTVAIFGGDSTGISLQENWPTIGFNQYRDSPLGNGKYMQNGYAAIQYFNPLNGSMVFDMFTNGTSNSITNTPTTSLVLGNNGNVGIKTIPSSNASLIVAKGNNFDGTAIFGGTDWNSHFNYSTAENTYIRAGKNGGTVFINDIPNAKVHIGLGDAKVGINVSNPQYTLDILQTDYKGILLRNPINGNHNWELKCAVYSTGNSDCLQLTYDGTSDKGWFRPDNGEYYANSDIRLKRNVNNMEPVLEKLMRLRPTTYEMLHDNPENAKSYGLIAQEVKEIFPEMVSILTNDVTDLPNQGLENQHGISYATFSIVAIKAIQEQQHMITDLLARVELLEAQNRNLDKHLFRKKGRKNKSKAMAKMGKAS